MVVHPLNQIVRSKIIGINESGISWKLSKLIRLGVFDPNTGVMSNSEMFAKALEEDTGDKCPTCFQSISSQTWLHIGIALEKSKSTAAWVLPPTPEILTLLIHGAAWEPEVSKPLGGL